MSIPDNLNRRQFLGATTALAGAAAMGGAAAPAAAAGPGAKTDELVMLDAVELSTRIKRRQVSCVEVMTAFLDHIDKHNPSVNAIVGLRDRGSLLTEAAERDRLLRQGRYLGWMHGFPHAVKDTAAAKGLPWTMGSPIFADRVADTDDLHVARIKNAGAIVIGKTNTPEFALGSQSYNEVWGTTTTPYDTTRTAGGSSGGAAAALALRMVPVADGSDYMGSLRNPAAYNNVLGLRPSGGRVPNTGFVAHAYTNGPMARTVHDTAALLSVMAGPDSGSPLSLTEDPAVFTRRLDKSFRGTKIAWVGDWNGRLATEPGVLDVCRSSFAAFEKIGCTVDEIVPDFDPETIWRAFLAWRWWVMVAWNDLYQVPELRRLLKPEAIWEIENGLRLSALDLTKAADVRDRWYRAVVKLFDTYDFILAPSAQVFPFDADVHWPTEINGRAMDTYHRWMEVVAPWSLTNLPALGMPAGFDGRGLPMGVQLIGKHNADLAVLQLGYAYEQATQWVQRTPPPALG
jgi:Asp-tRNA(Asn)/Glu-tRNA(Gln) amidotransferase A subunit family amidase